MPATDSDTGGLGLSLRSVGLVVLLLVVTRLGMGWASRLTEGEYLIGIIGVALVLAPAFWLVSQFRAAYF